MGIKHSCPQSVCCTTPQGSWCCDEITDENTPVAGVMSVQGISVLEWGPGSAPIGKVLDESLSSLSSLDRHLLLFSSTSSLAAVRWLLHLGACCDVSDANGSTCLHVACRAGGISVVMELMKFRCLLEATDVASWTPLHIAAHMGRREAVIRLLAAKASPHVRNAMGHTPAQICIDQNTKEALLREGWSGGDEDSDEKLLVPLSQVPRNDSMGIPVECEPELFFVTPEPAIRDTDNLRAKLMRLAVEIFNLQPSYGLAFVVASGLTDSYTAAMKMLLRTGEASRAKVGQFLGGTFSLCPLIRFGVFDSMALLNTGVVSALVLAFHSMQMPEDFQMIDRLVRGVAFVWWRKHRAEAQVRGGRSEIMPEWNTCSGELVGHDLLQYLASSDVLSQLMFSTVLLHWFVHHDGRRRPREMAVGEWIALNRGIENGGTDVPDHVQVRIHSIISSKFLSQLCLASTPSDLASSREEHSASRCGDAEQQPGRPSGSARSGAGVGPAPEGPSSPVVAGPSSVLDKFATLETWAQIVVGDIPYPNNDSLYTGVPEASCRFEDSGGGSYRYPVAVDDSSDWQEPADQQQSDGFVWASLCYMLILFSMRPSSDAASAPYAVIDARRLDIAHVDHEALSIGFVGRDLHSGGKADVGVERGDQGQSSLEQHEPVSVVVLLPDGRWREASIPKLELKFGSTQEMQEWVAKLVRGPLSFKSREL